MNIIKYLISIALIFTLPVFIEAKKTIKTRLIPEITTKYKVCIVIPAYREADNIEAAIDNAVAAVSSITTDYEIIVVDDGSPDNTAQYAQLKAESNSNIRVVSNADNQGFGYSFARGVKMSTKDYVTVFPGDNDMSAQSLKELIASRGGAM